MSIEFQILGQPGHDNALFVQINSGQSVHRLLFDCGEDCVNTLPFADMLNLEHLFFSHLHMDHVAGFDSLFRGIYARENFPMQVWGPANTSQIMKHRVQGFLWNLTEKLESPWLVHDVSEEAIQTTQLEYIANFETAQPKHQPRTNRTVLKTPEFSVDAVQLNHLTPSLAYVVREPSRTNIDTNKLTELGLKPGAWLRDLKLASPDQKTITVEGVNYEVEFLKSALYITSEGDSIAYLTDFLLNDAATEQLLPLLQGCKTLVCESQYRHIDLELARKNYHMTSVQVATLAQKANTGELILFHVSDRYHQTREWRTLLHEAQAIFPNTRFPAHWAIEPQQGL